MSNAHFDPSSEPVLELDDIQGIVVPGFFKPHQRLLYCRFTGKQRHIREFKTILAELPVSTGRLALEDRRKHRRHRFAEKAKNHPDEHTALCAVGLSATALKALTPGAVLIDSPAFNNGMVSRSALLGDSTTPNTPGNPSIWKVGAPGKEIDALIVIAGNYRDEVDKIAAAFEAKLEAASITVTVEAGDVRTDLPGHEHFGFDDGVSQPGIRGRASQLPDDFVTERHLAQSATPESWMFGYPGQDLVWPGEFVLGYPTTSPDPLIPGPVSSQRPDWTRNGSFLVYRRLHQNVALFWKTMAKEAERLTKFPGFDGLSDVDLASRLVGRWPSGAPFLRTPGRDIEELGKLQLANNSFLYDSDTPAFPWRNGKKDPYPTAHADPVGITCPLAAHIRKVNTRDSASDTGARSSTYDRRILRVGVPYGPPVAWKKRYTEDSVDRGLLFLSVQASIEQQFEFLQARWINDPTRPRAPSGHDMVVGQNAPAADGVRRCSIFSPETLSQAEVTAPVQWVTATGGGYFFVPSLSAIKNVLTK